MSAYVVDRNHIRYLVACAEYLDRRPHNPFSWFHDGERHDLGKCSEAGQMLWDENRKSVSHRYGTPIDGDLPGPVHETFVYSHIPTPIEWHPDVAQAFLSISCYTYQACETPEWEASDAYAFMEALREGLPTLLPGYDCAEWGAPEIPEEA